MFLLFVAVQASFTKKALIRGAYDSIKWHLKQFESTRGPSINQLMTKSPIGE